MTLARVDVTALLPDSWLSEVAYVSVEHGQWHELDGTDVTSRTVDERAGPARVNIVDGRMVVRDLPWLDHLYRHEFLELAHELGGPYVPTEDRSSITLNRTPPGCGYEWHVDSNPMTGILFATSATFGGELLMRRAGVEIAIQPEAGILYLFDGHDLQHCVTEVIGEDRISIPMCYLGEGEERMPGLSDYLYP